MLRSLSHILLASLLSVGVISCGKGKDESPGPSLGVWTTGGDTLKAISVLRETGWGGKAIKARANDAANTIVFSFSSYPTSSGQYQIVPSEGPIPANAMSVLVYNATSGSQSYYGSTSGAGNATITVGNDGKLSISTPLFIARRSTDSTEFLVVTVTDINEQ